MMEALGMAQDELGEIIDDGYEEPVRIEGEDTPSGGVTDGG